MTHFKDILSVFVGGKAVCECQYCSSTIDETLCAHFLSHQYCDFRERNRIDL